MSQLVSDEFLRKLYKKNIHNLRGSILLKNRVSINVSPLFCISKMYFSANTLTRKAPSQSTVANISF